jgi:hypothetical protein
LIWASNGTIFLSAAVHRVEVVRPQLGLDRELDQRDAPRHQVAHRHVALGLPQLARVHAVRRDRDVGLRGEVLLPVERLQRGLLTGLVTVEGEDDLAVHVVVDQQPAQHVHVVRAERGAARRDGRRHAGQVHRHHVGVALDDDGLLALRDLPLGLVEPEQHVRLLVDHRLAGVEVLRLDRVVVEDPPRTEPDHVAADLLDGPQQPPVEPVDRPLLALLDELRLDQLLELEPAPQQVLG